MTEFSIRERISRVLGEYKSSKRSLANGDSALERKLQRQISGETKSLDASTIAVFLNAYPEISAEWLIRGEGNMYLPEAIHTEQPVQQNADTYCQGSDNFIIQSLLQQLATKDAQIAEKDKQLAAAQAENAKLLDLANVKIIRSKFNDVKL